MSNQTTRKTSLDNDQSRSVGRSSNGCRTGSNDRVLKIKINKSKVVNKEKPALNGATKEVKNQKIIDQIQRMRMEGR
jgi:hypothetical protein